MSETSPKVWRSRVLYHPRGFGRALHRWRKKHGLPTRVSRKPRGWTYVHLSKVMGEVQIDASLYEITVPIAGLVDA